MKGTRAIPSVHLILIRGKRILLSRRFNTGWNDGNYSLVAGHIEPGESATGAMAREAYEEAGIRINPRDLKVVHVMYRMSSYDNVETLMIDFFMAAKRWKGRIRNAEPQMCDDLGWFSISRLPKNTIPYIRHAIGSIVKGIPFAEFDWKR